MQARREARERTSSVLHSVQDCVRLIDQIDLKSDVVGDLLGIPLNRDAVKGEYERELSLRKSRITHMVTRLMNGFPSFM